MEAFFKKTFFTKEQYQVVSDIFKLGKVKKVSFFNTHGFESSKAVLMTPGGKFIVSIYRLPSKGDLVSKSRLSIQCEIELACRLKDLPVPRYIKSINGMFIENIFNSMVTVYHYLPGHQSKHITEKKAYQLGIFLGKFHKLGKKLKQPFRVRRKFYRLPPPVIQSMDVYAKQQTHLLLKSTLKEIRDGVLGNQLPKNIPSGPVHVDIKPENELFIGERLTGVIDFGIFYRDVLLVDIGKTVMWNCYRANKIDQILFSNFMRGYVSQRTLTAKERPLLKRAILFGIYAHIYVDLYHIPLGRVPEAYTVSLVKTFLPVARWLEKHELY